MDRTQTMSNSSSGMVHAQTQGQYAIFRLARFTEPLPDNEHSLTSEQADPLCHRGADLRTNWPLSHQSPAPSGYVPFHDYSMVHGWSP